MLAANEVIHDRARAQLGRVQTPDGTVMRKVSKYVLQSNDLTTVDFLSILTAQPHPNLLIPASFSGVAGEKLVEDYPDLTGHERLDAAGSTIRGELADRCESLNRVVDFVVQMCDGIDFMHRNDFVHWDVRRQNVFVKRVPGRLVPIVFDYDLVTRPYFMEKPLIIAGRETPPEELSGQVMVNGRHDVYQLGWILRELTHYPGSPGSWKPVETIGEELAEAINRATGPLDERQETAGELRDDLLTALGDYRPA